MPPTLTSKLSVPSPWTFTAVVDPAYIAFINLIIPPSTPSRLNAHHKTSLGTLSNAFSKSTKAIHNSLRFCRYFSCTCLTTNTASVVPLPGINPKCMSSMQILPSIIFLLSLASTTLSNTFSPCSNNFTPLYDPHSRASPLPLYILTIPLLLQSSGTFPSLTTSLHSSVILPTPSSPIALNISATTPVGPAAVSSFLLLLASLTSSSLNIILSLLHTSPPPPSPPSPQPSLPPSHSSFLSLSYYPLPTFFF